MIQQVPGYLDDNGNIHPSEEEAKKSNFREYIWQLCRDKPRYLRGRSDYSYSDIIELILENKEKIKEHLQELEK